MINRHKKYILFYSLFFGALSLKSGAQDPDERAFMYPVLNPVHKEKPQINGWAATSVKENLNRGFIAEEKADSSLYLSWRLLESDPADISFNIYTILKDGRKILLTNFPVKNTTDFTDTLYSVLDSTSDYLLIPVFNNKEQENVVTIKRNAIIKSPDSFIRIKLRGDYMPSKIAVADLNGDGNYDYIIKQPDYGIDPGLQPDRTGTTYKIEAYLNDGTFLWQNDLGQGIEPGVWYSPYVVFDFNGDGKAEIAVKTSTETTRNSEDRIVSGPEYISIWDGLTGKEIARELWPDRLPGFGDYNRINRNQIGVAFLDGKTPCILVARGTYKQMVLDAYQLKGNTLEKLWRWDGNEEDPVIQHQGAHGMHSADVDNDGRDEVILGSVVIDDNGTALWSTGFGHPDKCFVTDIDPDRPGKEIFYAIEDWHKDGNGVCLVDAATGKTIWNIGHNTSHVGDGMVADIDPEIPGLECFASEDPKGGSHDKYMLSSKGMYLLKNEGVPDCRNWIYWDGDLLRETFPGGRRRFNMPLSIAKYKGVEIQSGIEGRILMIADIMGDWREELITSIPGEIRIYSTTLPANDKRICLMQDRVYRIEVAHRSMGYEQSPVPGYFLGETKK